MSKPNNKSLFSRGYKETRERVDKNYKYNRSCTNCAFYYQASGDREECCQNKA